MIDTSATHNFMNEQKTKRLGLQLLTEVGTIKAVNSGVRSIMGIAKDVPMKIGKWQGMLDFIVFPMNDFQIVLGLALFNIVPTILDTSEGTLIILD